MTSIGAFLKDDINLHIYQGLLANHLGYLSYLPGTESLHSPLVPSHALC